MSSDAAAPLPDSQVKIPCYFVRHRNALVVYGDFGRIFEDHYLHLMQLDVRLTPAQDTLLKDALSSLALHLASRPQNEAIAWTLNLREPPLNLFVTGDSQVGNVIGRVFTENVRVPEQNLFIQQVTRPNSPTRQSTIPVEGREMLSLVEQLYAQSEQLPARIVEQGGDAYAMVVAHPDIDLEWFKTLDADAIRALPETEDLRLLETRYYRFACGCSMKKILGIVCSVYRDDPEGLFQGEPTVTVSCPRCGGEFQVDPPTFEAYLRDNAAPDSES